MVAIVNLLLKKIMMIMMMMTACKLFFAQPAANVTASMLVSHGRAETNSLKFTVREIVYLPVTF